MKNIYLQVSERQAADFPMALATITGTIGSTPQKPGCSALFDQAGLLSGTVGGGILEAKVQEIAKTAMISRESGLHHFMLNNDISQQEEAICGGQVEVLLDATICEHIHVFDEIEQSLLKRIPGILVTRVTNLAGTQVSIHRAWVTRDEKHAISPDHLPYLEPVIHSIFSDGLSVDYREIIIPAGAQEIRYFLEPVLPLPRLVIAGAGHIGKALAHLGNLLDFEVVVIDERADYANTDNIPDADHHVVNDIGRTMQSLDITPDTYIAIVTRGHKNDADALKACIGSGAAYVGMIGSARKIALMRKSFIGEGIATQAQWESIYAPIGLDIHSKTVQEIAVSIASQLIQVRNQKVSAHA